MGRKESRMGDLISRQAAIDKIKKRLFETAFNNVGIKQNVDETLVDVAENRLENWFNELPSVQPERKQGKWVYGEDEYGIDGYHCDKCGFFVPWDYVHKFINYIEDYNFCPNCGADMRGEAE